MLTYSPVISAVAMTGSAVLQWDIVLTRNRFFREMCEEFGREVVAKIPTITPATGMMYTTAIGATILCAGFWAWAFYQIGVQGE